MSSTILRQLLIPGIEIAEFRISLEQTAYWNGVVGAAAAPARLKEGQSALAITSTMAIVVAVIVYTVTAIFVALSTQDMDQRADSIVLGLARLLSAVLFTLMSFKIPKWLGVYHSNKVVSNVGSSSPTKTGITVKQLKFNIRWRLWRHFAQVYILMMLQFCNASPETIPVSAVIGIAFGFVVFYGVYVGRTKWKAQKQCIALFLAGTISVFAALALASGVYYIDTVWKHDTGIDVNTLIAISFFVWLLVVCVPVHVLLWYNTKRKVAECTAGGRQYSYKYKTQMFEPTLFAQIQLEEQQRGEAKRQQQQQPINGDDDNDKKDGRAPGENKEDITNAAEDSGDDDVYIKVDEGVVDAQGDKPQGKDEEGAVAAAVGNDKDEDANAIERNENGKTEEGIDKARENEEDLLMKQIQELEQTETTWSLIRLHCCCCRGVVKDGERKPKTCLEKVLSVCKWAISLAVNGIFLYLVIVNIGATQQMATVRAHLPPAFEFLYPPEYNTGPICAWSEPTANATIQTFDTAQDAYNANFSIVHCGVCGSCSTWNDLRIQWTTRSVLAKMGQEW
jgi:hypothetical protein